jgi:hypothetical protein
MARQLKRWESPRREGRNDKGRGGAARKRQRQKQLKNLIKKLKQPDDRPNSGHNLNHSADPNRKLKEGRENTISSLFAYGRGKYSKTQGIEFSRAYIVFRSTTSVSRSIAVVNLS